jgi:hypothetical protein
MKQEKCYNKCPYFAGMAMLVSRIITDYPSHERK